MSDLEYKTLLDEQYALKASLLELKKKLSGVADTIDEMNKADDQINKVNQQIDNLNRKRS